MKFELEVPDYTRTKGIKIIWERGFTIDTKIENNVILLRANEAGLKSLATQLLTLAQSTTPSGCHVHYDETNSLEDGSTELIIEKL